jgi:hypothetical protein
MARERQHAAFLKTSQENADALTIETRGPRNVTSIRSGASPSSFKASTGSRFVL